MLINGATNISDEINADKKKVTLSHSIYARSIRGYIKCMLEVCMNLKIKNIFEIGF